MFAIGLVYMVFGTAIADGATPRSAATAMAHRDLLARSILGVQVGLIALAMYVTSSSVRSLQSKQGLPLGNQLIGWATLVLSLTVPLLHSTCPNPHYLHRLSILFLTFSPTFIILTISYEGLFYVVFCLLLATWVQLESLLSPRAAQTPRSLRLSDVRISLYLFFLLQSAFFSTGNIASISSFSLDSVYRLIPVFSPFLMGALLLYKLMIPFAVISANLAILNKRLNVGPSAVFMVVTAVSDVLTLNFFWMVRDEGSWLEIGSTISHFCIGGLLGVFVGVLEGGSGWWGRGVEVGGGEVAGGEKKKLGKNGVVKEKAKKTRR